MNKYYYFTFLLIFSSISLKAQKYFEEGKIIQLHPSTGFAISPDEKIKYALFPQFQDSVFEFAQLVKYNDSTFTFIFRTKYDGRFERSTTIPEISDIYNKIERVNPAFPKSISYFNPANPKSEPQIQYVPVDIYDGWISNKKRNLDSNGFDACDRVCVVVCKVLGAALCILAKGHHYS